MRNKLATCAILLLVVGAATELRAAEGRPAFGFRAGLNLASVYGDDADAVFDDADVDAVSPQSLSGFCAGVFVAIPVTDTLLLQPELIFSQKGASYDLFGEDLTLEFDYVEVPLLLKARFGGGAAKPSIFAGPAIGFKIRGEAKILDETEELENVKGMDFGIVLGAGLDLAAGPGSIVLDARYTLGLTSVDDSESTEFSEPADFKHGVWSFSVGYSF